MVDANNVGCGAVLLQENDSEIDRPMSYCSYIFNTHQKNYLTSEKETLALILTLQHFCVYLDGLVAEVLVYTDYNLLVFINHMRDNNQRLWWSFCIARVHFEN